MFRTFARKFLPNPLDWMLKRAAKRGAKTVCVCWNRGLGDIALGVAAIIHRIREFLPEAKITVLTRENLKDGFSLLPGIEVLVDPALKRGEQCKAALHYDLVIKKPSPTDWCRWQRGTFTPRLQWDASKEQPFDLSEDFTYIGVQTSAETNYGQWRNWPLQRWNELFELLAKRPHVRVLLFGYGTEPQFWHPNVIDLRGKTSFFELLSIIKNRLHALVLPDSGILSMAYYLDVSFPIRVISLFADSDHGILKQKVASPNPQLVHIPLLGTARDMSTVTALQVFRAIFPPLKPLQAQDIAAQPIQNAACVILAGGQGSRLGFSGPKGLFPVLGKPLFQYHMEKIPSSMPIAIMTSPLNHAETVAYFKDRKVHFFQQDLIPLLDEEHKPVEMGPDGNGGVYKHLVRSGFLDGVDTILITPVENPLADPADQRLLTYHQQMGADVTIKCVERRRGESMGVLTENGIMEYFEIEKDNYPYSYMGQVALSTRFIRKAAKLDLPYHWVRKNSLWKRERLLFDAFPIADRIQALCYPRELCYAPVKGPIIAEKVQV